MTPFQIHWHASHAKGIAAAIDAGQKILLSQGHLNNAVMEEAITAYILTACFRCTDCQQVIIAEPAYESGRHRPKRRSTDTILCSVCLTRRVSVPTPENRSL